MSHHQATNFTALGLRDHSPFAVLLEVRQPTTPATKQKSGWQRKLEARAKAEGRNPDSAKAQTDKILRVNKESNVGRSTVGAGDRSARIRTSGVC